MLSKKLTTAITTFSTIAAIIVTPTIAFADTSVGAIGNGAESQNQVNVSQTNTNTAVQSNTANVSNNVNANASSGGNHADFTTGGSSLIETGPATNNVQVANELNRNVLQSNPCNCANDATQVVLGGNGALSANGANVSSTNNNSMFQTNDASVNNSVNANASTGKNSADYSTGGDNAIITGAAKDNVGILNALNQNVAMPGAGNGVAAGSANGTDVREIGNGALSQNQVDVTKANTNVAEQNNSAYVMNDVTSNAKTGQNSSDFGTGGSTLISTGPAWNNTGVATYANSNFMAGDNCGCGDFTFLKSEGNGALSGNNISAALSNNNSQFQTNDANVQNDVNANAKSGLNSADYSTSTPFGFSDPTVITGGTYSNTNLVTQTNDNEVGGMSLGGWNLNFTLSNPFAWMQ